MIPHSRKDTSGRTQLSKAELELIFKLYQKGGKEGGSKDGKMTLPYFQTLFHRAGPFT